MNIFTWWFTRIWVWLYLVGFVCSIAFCPCWLGLLSVMGQEQNCSREINGKRQGTDGTTMTKR